MKMQKKLGESHRPFGTFNSGSNSFSRGSTADIYDIAWSPCGQYIVSGSIDNTTRIWGIDAKCHHVLPHHTNYVQGVAWDPLGDYIATQSSDRTILVYKYEIKNGKFILGKPAKITKLAPPPNQPNEGQKVHKDFRMFHDENLNSFFRRLSFSADGAFLLAPSGLHRTSSTASGKNAGENTVYLFARNTINRCVSNQRLTPIRMPVAHLPGLKKPAVVISANPVRYELRDVESPFKLPHRTVYAVVTQDEVLLYDTQTINPIASFSGLHYAPYTDAAWSSDGKTFIVASSDGYCTLFEFEDGELGRALPPLHVPQLPAANELPPDTNQSDDVIMLDAAGNPEPIIIATNQTSEGLKKKKIQPTLISGL